MGSKIFLSCQYPVVENLDLDDPDLNEENDESVDEVADLSQSFHLMMEDEENSVGEKLASIDKARKKANIAQQSIIIYCSRIVSNIMFQKIDEHTQCLV